jgi:hypothetical protein
MRNKTMRFSLGLLIASTFACARATATVPIVTPGVKLAAQVSDLRLPRDTHIVVQWLSGRTLSGRMRSITRDQLLLGSTDATGKASDGGIPDDEIALVARVVKTSSAKRRCLGAAIGAAASLPFAISRFADMVVPGAIAGALIARGTAHARAEVVFERQQISESERAGARFAGQVE